MKMKSSLLLTLLLTALITSACAANAPVTAKLRFLSIGDAPKRLTLVSDGVSTELDLVEGTRSPTINYLGPKELELIEVGDPGRTVALELPDKAGEWLIVLLPNGLTAKTLVLEDAESAFPGGTVQFSNLSGAALALAAGEESATLNHGSATVLALPKDKVAAFVKISAEGGTDTYFSNNWAISLKTRTLVMILPPDGEANLRPRVSRLVETLPIKR